MHAYPRLLTLLACLAAAYVGFQLGFFDWLPQAFGGNGYASLFVAGVLFSFGFTAPFAVVIFIELSNLVHPGWGALIGGAGALLSDYWIFQLMKYSIFHEEVNRLKSTKLMTHLHRILHHEKFPAQLRRYIVWSFAGIVLASPLPDEIGVVLVSGISEMNSKRFAFMCYVFNSLGIFLILEGTRLLAA